MVSKNKIFDAYFEVVIKSGFSDVLFGLEDEDGFQEILEKFKENWINGKNYSVFVKNLPANLQSLETLKLFYEHHSEGLFDFIRYLQLIEKAKLTPYWEYVESPEQTNPVYRALNGIIRKYNDPFWRIWFPPNQINCKARIKSYNEDMLREARLYAGSGIPTYRELIEHKRLDESAIPDDIDLDKEVRPEPGFDRLLFPLLR
jgi:hypothetical protein